MHKTELNNLRILHLASEPLTLELFVHPLSKKFDEIGVRFFFGSNGTGDSTGGQSGRSFDFLLPRGRLVWLAWFRNRQLISVVEQTGCSVIHVHTPATAIALYPYLRKLGKAGKRLVYTARGGFYEGAQLSFRTLWKIFDPLRWEIWAAVGTVNTVLHESARSVDSMRPSILLDNGGAPPNATLYEFPGSGSSRGRGDFVSLGWVGRFSRDKKVEDFIDLIKTLNSRSSLRFRGVIMGSPTGTDRNFPKRIPTEIKVLGWVESPQKHLRDLDLLVSTSIREGYGLTVLEAAMAGTPAICYSTSGTVQSLEASLSRLVRPGDVAGLADAVLSWVMLTEREKLDLRQNVLLLARRNFDADNLFRQSFSLYRSAMSAEGSESSLRRASSRPRDFRRSRNANL